MMRLVAVLAFVWSMIFVALGVGSCSYFQGSGFSDNNLVTLAVAALEFTAAGALFVAGVVTFRSAK